MACRSVGHETPTYSAASWPDSQTAGAVVERERWSFADSFTDEFCGIEADFDVEGSGLFMIRADRPGSTAFLASNLFEYREVITNPGTGASLVIRGKGNFREATAHPGRG